MSICYDLSSVEHEHTDGVYQRFYNNCFQANADWSGNLSYFIELFISYFLIVIYDYAHPLVAAIKSYNPPHGAL